MSAGENVIQTVISTLKKLSEGQPNKIAEDSNMRDENCSEGTDPYSKPTDVFANDIYYQILQHSGRHKKKCRSNIVKSLYDRSISNRVTPGDNSYISCRLIPDQRSHQSIYFASDKTVRGTFEKNGDLFICASQNGTIRVYDTRTIDQELLMEFGESPDEINKLSDCTTSRDAKYVAYGLCSGKVVIQSIEDDKRTKPCVKIDNLLLDGSHARCLKFCPSRDELITVAWRPSMSILDLETLKPTLQLTDCGRLMHTIAFADDSSQIFYTGDDKGLIKIWDRRTLHEEDAKPVGTIAGHEEPVHFIDSKNDIRYFISSSFDQKIKLWDLRRFTDNTMSPLTPWASQENTSSQSGDSPQARSDVCVMTYSFRENSKCKIRCRFSPMATTGQSFILTGSDLGNARIYDVLTGKVVRILGGEGQNSRHLSCDVSWHPYLPIIRTTGSGRLVREWIYMSGTNHPCRMSKPKCSAARRILLD